MSFALSVPSSHKISLLLMGLNFALALILIMSPFSYVASQPVVVGLALIGINGIDLYKEKYMEHKKDRNQNARRT